MEILFARISKSELSKIPETERVYLLLIGHLSNELNILSKILTMCLNKSGSTNEAIERAHLYQGLLIAKLLVGKLYEGWGTIKKAFFNPKLSKAYVPILEQSAKEALNNLKQYFSKDNFIKNVRNKLAFHYSPEKFNSAFNIIPDDAELAIYLAESNANSFYHLSEVIGYYAILQMADPKNFKSAIDYLFRETLKVNDWFLEFIGNCMYLISEKYLLDESGKLKLIPISIEEPPFIFDVIIPYFVKHPQTIKR